MRIVLTGSSGRIGRAIYNALVHEGHQVIGIDKTAFSTTHITADFVNFSLLTEAMKGANAVIHTAALHAPHVGLVPDSEFERVNVEGTRLIIEAAKVSKIKRLIFTSTTALFGRGIEHEKSAWVTDETTPKPRTIYHLSKLAAEAVLKKFADEHLAIRVIRMSRCFPEPADIMCIHRLARGIDVRDVASAHVAALTNGGSVYQNQIVSGATPFAVNDCLELAANARIVLQKRVPSLVTAFEEREWELPESIDRVYLNVKAMEELEWKPRYGFEEVLAQLDRFSLEVLPVNASIRQQPEYNL